MYEYTWNQWLLFFYSYCFIGWIIESTYVSVRTAHFVNRGFLRLPLLPLYGSGAIIMLWLCLPLKGNFILVFLLGMVGASVLEYVTGYVMERLFKMKYWDYSSKFLNLHGYICLGTSIAWGVLTIVLIEIVHRPLAWGILRLNMITNLVLVSLLSVVFILDTIHSTKEALNLGRLLESMTKIKTELEDVQLQLSLLKAETTQKVTELKKETFVKISSIKAETTSVLKESSLMERLQSLTESKETLTKRLAFTRKGILHRNPTASSRLFGDALKELKELSKKYRKY